VAAAGDIASYLVHQLSAVSFAKSSSDETATTAVDTGVPKADTHDSGHSAIRAAAAATRRRRRQATAVGTGVKK
jgi:hypothetical protein